MYLILDADLKPVGRLDFRTGNQFYADTRTVQIADDQNGKLWNDTLTVTVPYENEYIDYLTEGYHLVKQGSDGLYYCFRINSWEDQPIGATHVKVINAVNLAIWDLSHAVLPKQTLTNALVKDAFGAATADSGWQLKLNTDSTTQKTITVDNGTTGQALMQQIITDFAKEVRAYITLDGSGVGNKVIEITDRLGEDTGERIEYGVNATDITRTGGDDTLFTKLHIYGGTPEGADEPISIADKNGGKDFLTDDAANDLYNHGGKYLEGYITNDALTNVQALLDWGRTQLQYYNHPKYNYTVTAAALNFDAALGDGVIISDPTMRPPLLLSARAIQQTESESNPQSNTITFGEFIEIKAVTIADVAGLQEKLRQYAQDIGSALVTVSRKSANSWGAAEPADTDYTSVGDTYEQIDSNGNVIATWTRTADGWTKSIDVQGIKNSITSGNGNLVYLPSTDEPTDPAPKAGDLWYKIVDADHGTTLLMQFDGSKWVSHVDQTVKEMQDVVGLLPKSFFSATAPTSGMAEGDIWYEVQNLSDGSQSYVPHKYDGTKWIALKAAQDIVAGNIAGVNLTGNNLTLAGVLAVTGSITAASGDVVLSSSGLTIARGSINLANTQISSNGTLTTRNATVSGTITGSTITGSKFVADNGTTSITIQAETDNTPAIDLEGTNKWIHISSDTIGTHGAEGGSGAGSGVEYSVEIDTEGAIKITHSENSGGSTSSYGTITMSARNNEGLHIYTDEGTVFQAYMDGRIWINGATTARENISLTNGAFLQVFSGSDSIQLGYNSNNFQLAIHGNGTLAGEKFDITNPTTGVIFSVDNKGTYGWTTSAGANCYINSGSGLMRSVSATKYKDAIAYDVTLDYAKKLLSVSPATWHDKNEDEALAYAAEHDGQIPSNWPDVRNRKYVGVIAEDLEEAGLPELLIYGQPDENGKRAIEGVEYDKLAAVMLPLVKNLYQEIEALKARVTLLEGAA